VRAGIPEPGTGQSALKGVGLGLEACLGRWLACAPLGLVGSNPTPGANQDQLFVSWFEVSPCGFCVTGVFCMLPFLVRGRCLARRSWFLACFRVPGLNWNFLGS